MPWDSVCRASSSATAWLRRAAIAPALRIARIGIKVVGLLFGQHHRLILRARDQCAKATSALGPTTLRRRKVHALRLPDRRRFLPRRGGAAALLLDLNFPDYAAGLPQSVGRFQSVAPTAALPAGGISGSSAPSPPSFEQLAPPPNLVLVIHTLNHERPREHLEPTVRAYGRRPRRPLGGASSTPSWRA